MSGRAGERIRDLDFAEVVAPLVHDERVCHMRGFVQHGRVTTYAHCLRVAQLSWRLSCKLRLRVNARDLVYGAMLHDFYLYDWHDRSSSKPCHATRHPLYAADNAIALLDVDEHVASIIRTHMWPLPPTRVPSSTEAWVVCLADKIASLEETLFMRGRKAGGQDATGLDDVREDR